MARRLLRGDRRTPQEMQVMRLAGQTLMSTAEIIKCMERGFAGCPMRKAFWTSSMMTGYTTSDNIAYLVKSSASSKPVILAIANLYLRQQIILKGCNMMEQWNRCPYVLKKKNMPDSLAGLSSVLVSLVVYMVSADSVLSPWAALYSSAACSAASPCGILSVGRHMRPCQEPVPLSPCRRSGRYRRICVTDLSGKEHTLLLSGQAAVQTGAQYRFYFQREHRPVLGNDYLDTVLSTNAFLGYEKLSEDNAEKE